MVCRRLKYDRVFNNYLKFEKNIYDYMDEMHTHTVCTLYTNKYMDG